MQCILFYKHETQQYTAREISHHRAIQAVSKTVTKLFDTASHSGISVTVVEVTAVLQS